MLVSRFAIWHHRQGWKRYLQRAAHRHSADFVLDRAYHRRPFVRTSHRTQADGGMALSSVPNYKSLVPPFSHLCRSTVNVIVYLDTIVGVKAHKRAPAVLEDVVT